MSNVSVSISAILMCCDDSAIGINIGRGYTLKKAYYNELSFKNSITDGQNKLLPDYCFSQLKDCGGVYFICLSKDDQINIDIPAFDGKLLCSNNLPPEVRKQIAAYADCEVSYLFDRINLLKLFRVGNIGYKTIFFDFYLQYPFIGMPRVINYFSQKGDRNIVDSRKFVLSADEVVGCNSFLLNYEGKPYELLRECINVFAHGLEQIDAGTSFEQYTIAIEMALLEKNQKGKKQALANRVATILGSNNSEIKMIHDKMVKYYCYRSQAVHEGNYSNISSYELQELEGIVRGVLFWCLEQCRRSLVINGNSTWEEVKAGIIADTKKRVMNLQTQNVLPT